MQEQAIVTVEELPAELRAELVAKREAGTTLAELKKAYAHVAPDVIRAVLPPLPKPTTDAKPRTRKPQATKPAQTAPAGQRKGGRSAAAEKLAAGQAKAATAKGKSKPAAKAAATDGTDDKARLELARKVVAARDKDGLSWLKIGARFKLSTSEQPKAGASRARTLYRLVKGDDADTGPLPAKV
jgi:primosomal protein N'